ncbi:MAG: helix-turn-helix domain-containing protein [Clostridiales bacterium]|nr:helix-turn-helix domain-containing protein [Clostridiales bacterium]
MPTKSIENYLRESECTMGISRNFENLDEFLQYYAQAATALDLCRNLSPNSSLCSFDDFYLTNIYRNILAKSVGNDFMDSRLLDILSYDKINATDYLYDLYLYLVTGCSVTKTSAILGIHRNTVNYRIRTICQLFSLNLKDPETVFALGLSLRVYYFKNEQEKKKINTDFL